MNPGILLVVEESATDFRCNKHKTAVHNILEYIHSIHCKTINKISVLKFS